MARIQSGAHCVRDHHLRIERRDTPPASFATEVANDGR